MRLTCFLFQFNFAQKLPLFIVCYLKLFPNYDRRWQTSHASNEQLSLIVYPSRVLSSNGLFAPYQTHEKVSRVQKSHEETREIAGVLGESKNEEGLVVGAALQFLVSAHASCAETKAELNLGAISSHVTFNRRTYRLPWRFISRAIHGNFPRLSLSLHPFLLEITFLHAKLRRSWPTALSSRLEILFWAHIWREVLSIDFEYLFSSYERHARGCFSWRIRKFIHTQR